eukprot:scaffold991_cov128-Cylindrotheca_fusiformis.AAC.33
MRSYRRVISIVFLFLGHSIDGFSPNVAPQQATLKKTTSSFIPRYLSDDSPSNEPELKFSRSKVEKTINLDENNSKRTDDDEDNSNSKAATNTVNERLMAELKEAQHKEKFGARSSVGKKMGVDGFGRPRKTDEEIRKAIEEARDLNGVNPVVAITGSLFALGVAAGLWYATKELGIFFASNPIDSDVYFVQRSAQVVRNIAMGLISLASGFFGVTGIGIFLLGVRVAYGVLTGELDPTPIKQNQEAKVEMPNVWDLMMNKKPGRRGRGKGKGKDDNNMFGL